MIGINPIAAIGFADSNPGQSVVAYQQGQRHPCCCPKKVTGRRTIPSEVHMPITAMPRRHRASPTLLQHPVHKDEGLILTPCLEHSPDLLGEPPEMFRVIFCHSCRRTVPVSRFVLQQFRSDLTDVGFGVNCDVGQPDCVFEPSLCVCCKTHFNHYKTIVRVNIPSAVQPRAALKRTRSTHETCRHSSCYDELRFSDPAAV